MNAAYARFDWTHARTFLAVARTGSYSSAARALQLTQPTVGRHVAALEASLGVLLVERVGRGIALTEPGTELADHVAQMDEVAQRVALAAAGQSTALEGRVRLTASEVMTAHVLPPVLAALRSAHPRIELELIATTSVQDLRRRDADVAVRNGRPSDPDLIARRVADVAARLYATPAYLASIGNPSSAAALAERVEIFAFDGGPALGDGLRALGLPVTERAFPITASNHLVQWELAKQGLGVCVMMESVGDADPAVTVALPSLPAIPVPTWVTSHRELHTSRRIRVVFDALVAALGTPPRVGP